MGFQAGRTTLFGVFTFAVSVLNSGCDTSSAGGEDESGYGRASAPVTERTGLNVSGAGTLAVSPASGNTDGHSGHVRR